MRKIKVLLADGRGGFAGNMHAGKREAARRTACSRFVALRGPATGLLIGSLMALWLAAPAQIGAATAYKATVTFLKGIARVQTHGDSKYANLNLGHSISEGDTVTTLQNTKVEHKLENGSIIRLGSSAS